MTLPSFRIVEGRRPDGLVVPPLADATNVLGDYFARAAFLEAASAVAFGRLARELTVHGAPDALIRRCLAARAREVRHAQSYGALAARFGVRPVAPKATKARVRPLIDIALENIVEGVVRETYGAAVAQHRARTATDPAVRSVMEEIARDEQVNARLSFDVAMWLQAEIDPVEGAWVENALRHAATSLALELDAEVASELCASAGLPTRREALAIWSDLSKRVWHSALDRVWSDAA